MVEAFVLPSVFCFVFLVKNSLSFINKLPYFFTKITVYIPTLSLPLEKNVSLGFAFSAHSGDQC